MQLEAIIRTDSTFKVRALLGMELVADELELPLAELELRLATVPFTSTCSFTCDESSDSCPSSMYSADEPDVPVAVALAPPVEAVAEDGADSFKMYEADSLPRVPVVPVVEEAELGADPLDRQPVTVIVPAALALDVALDVDGVCVVELDDDGACANTPATENAAATATAPVQVFHCCM